MSFDNQRLFDLVRQQRIELYQAELIDDEEYVELTREHSAVRRLEDYDVIQAQLASLKAEHAKEIEKLTGDLDRSEEALETLYPELKRLAGIAQMPLSTVGRLLRMQAKREPPAKPIAGEPGT